MSFAFKYSVKMDAENQILVLVSFWGEENNQNGQDHYVHSRKQMHNELIQK